MGLMDINKELEMALGKEEQEKVEVKPEEKPEKELSKTGFKNLMPLERNRIIRYWKAKAKDEGKEITIKEDEIILGEDVRIDKKILDLLEQRKLWDYIVLDELDKKHKGDIKAKEVMFLCAVGRLVKNKKPYSFNCLVLAPSSSGKDHLVASVLKLFPKGEQERYGRTSRTTLNYLHTLDQEPDYNYDGKILYLPEIEESILNNEIMLEFTSGEEEYSKVAITKHKGAGVDVKEIRGHPEVFTTTATTIPTEEIRNRYNIVGLDLSDEQTARTFERSEEYNEEIIKFVSGLKSLNVEIPDKMYNFIKKEFGKGKVRYRRDFQKLLDFVKVLALFHGRTVANSDDYNRAKDIFINAFSSVGDIPLKDIDRRIVKALEDSAGEIPLPARAIHNEIGGIINLSNLYNHLRNLVAKEIIIELTDRIGGYLTTNYALSEEYKDKKPFVLPNYEE